jgi:hypothetical protein
MTATQARRRCLLVSAMLVAALFVSPLTLDRNTVSPFGGRTNQIQRGFALPTWQANGYDGPQVDASLHQIASLGAGWVQLVPTWYQMTAYATDIVQTPRTASDAGVERAILLAHEHELKVLLKPHIDLMSGQDRADIRPHDRAAWFAEYKRFISHYAAMAARLNVEQLAICTELASVSNDRASWLDVINTVRAQYRGPLVYAANFNEYQRVAFWDALDMIGIDAYWPLTRQATTDANELKSSWRPIREELMGFAAKKGRRIVFTEAGYTSQHGTTTAPYRWTLSKTPAPAEQAAAYQALLASFGGQKWWAGVYWWVWSAPPDPVDLLDYSPQGKDAEQVVRRWWTG